MAQSGDERNGSSGRRWWDYLIVGVATAVFLWLASMAAAPQLVMHLGWAGLLVVVLLLSLIACGWLLHKRTGIA